MGFFAAIGAGAKKVFNATKEAVSNVWASITGKSNFDKAEQLYDETAKLYESKQLEFRTEVDKLIFSIEESVRCINEAKHKIKSELFVKMATELEKIKDIRFDKDFAFEIYKGEALNFEGMNSKSQLYKIDFSKTKTKVLAVLTLGFSSRKKARETLYAVQEERKKIEHEIAKMHSELDKLRLVDKSLKNVAYYFTSLTDLYEQLLIRLNNSVHYLYYKCLHFANKVVSQGMSIKLLPSIQQKEIEAIITASKILKKMAETQILTIEDQSKVTQYKKIMEESKNEIVDIYKAA